MNTDYKEVNIFFTLGFLLLWRTTAFPTMAHGCLARNPYFLLTNSSMHITFTQYGSPRKRPGTVCGSIIDYWLRRVLLKQSTGEANVWELPYLSNIALFRKSCADENLESHPMYKSSCHATLFTMIGYIVHYVWIHCSLYGMIGWARRMLSRGAVHWSAGSRRG